MAGVPKTLGELVDELAEREKQVVAVRRAITTDIDSKIKDGRMRPFVKETVMLLDSIYVGNSKRVDKLQKGGVGYDDGTQGYYADLPNTALLEVARQVNKAWGLVESIK